MKIRVMLPLILILFLLLSACGNGGDTSTSGGSVDKNGHVTLEFWYSLSGDSGDALTYLVDQFNNSQSEITVVATYQGDYAATQAKLYSAIAGETTPSVAQVGGAALLGSSGAVIPIGDYINGENGIDSSQIYDAFLDYNKAEGVLWSMPFNNSLPIMYYNKDLFVAAGLDPEDPPETMDELIEVAKQLTVTPEGTSTPTQWGVNSRPDVQWYLSTFILENGGAIVNEDESAVVYNEPEAVEMLDLWGKMVNEYKIMPPNQHNEANSDFLAGKLGIYLASSASFRTLTNSAPFEVGVAMMPIVDEAIGRKLPVGGGSLVIFKNSNQAILDASWEFVKFMTSKESSAYLATHTGYLPIYKDAYEWPEIIADIAEHPEGQAPIDSLNYAVVIPEFSALGDSDTAIRSAVQKVELQTATAQEAMDYAKTYVDNSIAQMKGE